MVEDGTLVHMNADWFAVKSGQVWYRHRCRRVLVFAESIDTCYNALPVTMSPETAKRYWRARLPEDATEEDLQQHLADPESGQLFLQPSTQVLTTEAEVRPCFGTFPPMYKTAKAQWIVAYPELRPAVVQPEDVLLRGPSEEGLGRAMKDWAYDKKLTTSGGLYSKETMHKWAKWIQAPFIRQAIGWALSVQTEEGEKKGRRGWGESPLGVTKVFQSLKDPWSTFWDPIRNSFREYGIICAGILVSYYIGLALFRVMGCIIKCGALPSSMGWKGRLASATFPGGAQFALSNGYSIFHHIWGKCGCDQVEGSGADSGGLQHGRRPPEGHKEDRESTYKSFQRGPDRTTPEGSEPRRGEEGPRRLTEEQKRLLAPTTSLETTDPPPMQQALGMAEGDLNVTKTEEPAAYAAVVASRIRRLQRATRTWRTPYPNIEEELTAAQATANQMSRLYVPPSTTEEGRPDQQEEEATSGAKDETSL